MLELLAGGLALGCLLALYLFLSLENRVANVERKTSVEPAKIHGELTLRRDGEIAKVDATLDVVRILNRERIKRGPKSNQKSYGSSNRS